MVDFNKKEKVFNLRGIAVSTRTIEMIHEVATFVHKSKLILAVLFDVCYSWVIRFLSSQPTSTQEQSSFGPMG